MREFKGFFLFFLIDLRVREEVEMQNLFLFASSLMQRDQPVKVVLL